MSEIRDVVSRWLSDNDLYEQRLEMGTLLL